MFKSMLSVRCDGYLRLATFRGYGALVTTEGVPFVEPVAMRVFVGSVGRTVGRIRLG